MVKNATIHGTEIIGESALGGTGRGNYAAELGVGVIMGVFNVGMSVVRGMRLAVYGGRGREA